MTIKKGPGRDRDQGLHSTESYRTTVMVSIANKFSPGVFM
jgi:hypothetical protein